MRILPVLEKLALVYYAQNSFNPAVVSSESENIHIIKYLLRKCLQISDFFVGSSLEHPWTKCVRMIFLAHYW